MKIFSVYFFQGKGQIGNLAELSSFKSLSFHKTNIKEKKVAEL